MARPKNASDLSPEELFAYSAEHLAHEVLMLSLARQLPRQADRVLETALFEGSLLHARTIIAFFYGKPRDADVSWRLFFDVKDGWTPPKMSESLNRLRD